MGKILITGSSGMIGTALFQRLLYCEKLSVMGLDWKKNIFDKDIENLTEHVDLRDFRKLNTFCDFDTIVHLAANARVYDLVEKPRLAFDNSIMTRNILEFARQKGIKRIIFSSSREVYGNSNRVLCSEEDVRVENCESPYSASKFGDEALIWAYSNCYNMDFIILRLSNVYGAFDESDRVIPLFIHKTMNRKVLEIYGENKFLDFTFITDAVDAIVRAISQFDSVKGEVYNIGIQHGYSILSVAQMIAANMVDYGIEVLPIKYGKSRTGEVNRYVANISKAKAILGYNPKYDLSKGLKETIGWYASRNNIYKKTK